MKIHAMLVLAFAILSQTGVAQVTSVDADIDAELSQMYHNQTAQQAPQYSAPVQTQTTYAAPAYQKQPTTVIEASPLSDSRAEQIRKNRQEEELRTESRIVEKLEQSRIEDEKKRASVLFGDKFDSLQNGQPTQPVQQMPVQQPQPIIIQQPLQPDSSSTRDLVREEMRMAMEEENQAVEAPLETKYFGGILGITEYPDVQNIKSNYTLGATFGSKYDAMMVEGSFLVSNFDMQMAYLNPYNSYLSLENYEINQFSGALAVKYQLFQGIVRPVVGGTMIYSYRNYTYVDYGMNKETGTSHAVDFGAIAGADLEFNSKMSLGLEFKYMFNLLSRINSNNGSRFGYNSNWGYSGPQLEKMQYYVMTVIGRVAF